MTLKEVEVEKGGREKKKRKKVEEIFLKQLTKH